MRVHRWLKLSLVAVTFVVLGLAWSWGAGGIVALAALLLFSGGWTSGANRRLSSPGSDGTGAIFPVWDTPSGGDSGSSFDGGGGCGGE